MPGNPKRPELPLQGLRVLEFATGISGPYAGKMLCDAGAEVVKIEPLSGDPIRRFTASGTPLDANEDSAFFRYLNASKKSVVADSFSPEDRDLVQTLGQSADLILEGVPHGSLAEFELEWETLQAANPGLSIVSISPWGLQGPAVDRAANAFTFEAACGSTLRRTLPGRSPVASGLQMGEFATGAYAAAGALAAWIATKQSGFGQRVDVSTYETVINVLTTFFGLRGQWMEGSIPAAAEAPSIERAKDGWVGLCTYTGQQWKDFCALIQRPDLAEDDRFLHAFERFVARDQLQDAFWAWSRERSVDEIVELASLLRVPSAPVLDAKGVLECDHYRARGIFVENPHGFRQPRPPYRLDQCELRPIGHAPALGEHSKEGSLWPPRIELARTDPAKKSARPFQGLRVIDLTAFWAGPVATGLLADLGADVVKIESIQRPDGMRFIGATGNQPLWEWSEVFAGANCSKRSVTLNLDSAEGREILMQLLENADVLAENASARVLENFGLDFETLSALNPRLVVLRMPAWGLDGPWRDRPGFAANIEQASGIAWMTGYEDAPMSPLACDPIGGMHAAFGLMTALEDRERTGKGQLVESSLIEPALNIAALPLIEFDAYGALLARAANRSSRAAPQGMYRCREARAERDPEWIAIAIENDEQWRGLCRALEHPDWCREQTLSNQAGRRAAHDRIDAEIEKWCAERHAAEVELALRAENVPAAAARNAHYLLPDEQLDARGCFQPLEHSITGITRYPNLPMQFPALGVGLKTGPPPTLGQHNDEILRGELGISSESLDRLREKKIIGERPDF
jgi:crotonobetainyl-CoA:carnitine CoA-transferase CaiB-like acyl-CoA transferase